MFEYIDEVRDSELDLQGIVNNSNYFVYMEHARHKYLKSLGIDFKLLHDLGCDLVVSKANISFKLPLKSGDEYKILTSFSLASPVRILVSQKIIKKTQEQSHFDNSNVSAQAEFIITGVDVKTGKINISKKLLDILK